MPDEILGVVSSVVKVADQLKQKGAVEEQKVRPAPLPKAEAQYNDSAWDFDDALEPGERYLTPAEAAERKERIKTELAAQGAAQQQQPGQPQQPEEQKTVVW